MIRKICYYFVLFHGCFDLLRGIMHTFLSRSFAVNVAKLNVSQQGENQIFLINALGFTNYITGSVYLLICYKAPFLAPDILGILGTVNLFMFFVVQPYVQVKPTGSFPGRLGHRISNLINLGLYLVYLFSE